MLNDKVCYHGLIHALRRPTNATVQKATSRAITPSTSNNTTDTVTRHASNEPIVLATVTHTTSCMTLEDNQPTMKTTNNTISHTTNSTNNEDTTLTVDKETIHQTHTASNSTYANKLNKCCNMCKFRFFLSSFVQLSNNIYNHLLIQTEKNKLMMLYLL